MERVYLAGPTVFFPDADQRFDRMKVILQRYGLSGVAPIDNQIGLEGLPVGLALATAIYRADENLMNAVDAAIFNIDPFRRGTEMDAGTAFEVGYCKAKGLPMVGWCVDGRDYPAKVRHFMKSVFGESLVASEANGTGGTSGALRDPDGVLVHSEGQFQNLMIDVAIKESGGAVYADQNWERAFDLAAHHLAGMVGSNAGA